MLIQFFFYFMGRSKQNLTQQHTLEKLKPPPHTHHEKLKKKEMWENGKILSAVFLPCNARVRTDTLVSILGYY
jgi:hypothetical protein